MKLDINMFTKLSTYTVDLLNIIFDGALLLCSVIKPAMPASLLLK